MKARTFLYATLAAAGSIVAESAAAQCGVNVENASLQRNADLMTATMDIDLSDFVLKRNRAAVFQPVVVNGSNSVKLAPTGIYRHNRWIKYLRSGRKPVSGDAGETSIRYRKHPSEISVHEHIPYQEWMNGADLILTRTDYCCRGKMRAAGRQSVAGYSKPEPVVYSPEYRYVRPEAVSVKTRELSGRAYIDFLVGRTEIRPDYRNNSAELHKITATIDSIRLDRDITVSSLAIIGYASPEGPYEDNARLAKGRTEALKKYVQGLYGFAPDFISTDYVPEDWVGLREFVAESQSLANRKELLEIIDDESLQPDTKDWRMKLRYESDYKILLAEAYPSLRHSDYRIEYEVRQFSDAAEIARIMAESPQKLSLNEFFVLAQTLDEGSDEFNEVFETAVRMFPSDQSANLNAANAAMARNDLAKAEKYLNKAGDGAEAIYARGVLAALRGDYDKAITLVEASGLNGTQGVVEHLKAVKNQR